LKITAKLSKGFVSGYDFDLLLMAVSVNLLLTGPRKPSIEWEIFPKGKGLASSIQRRKE
jgi:putative oxidoreductase